LYAAQPYYPDDRRHYVPIVGIEVALQRGPHFLSTRRRGILTAADAATSIAYWLTAGDSGAATQVLLQFANGMSKADAFEVQARTGEAPRDCSHGWSWAIAGIVELAAQRVGISAPNWALATSGDPSTTWTPWSAEVAAVVDLTRIPEPLRRRGVLIEGDELTSA